jgi:hypothetical protein
MDLSKILSISGKAGLFKVVSQLKNAVLVESLIDKKRFPAFAHDKISSLEEIAVFTEGEDKPLKEILKVLHEKLDGKPAVDSKSGDKEIREFFLQMVPDYDQERVYVSDMRKIISWYNLLLEHNLLDFSEKSEEVKETQETIPSDDEAKGEVKETQGTRPKVAKKTGATKSAPKNAGTAPKKKKTEE